MKLKKMALHEEHEFMSNVEMKKVAGGQMARTSTCAKNGDICSGYCDDIVEKDFITGKTTIYKQTCKASLSADRKNFICGCEF